MLVRPVRRHDIDTIADVFVASFRGLTFLPIVHTDDEIRLWVGAELVPRHELWVAELEGAVVGFAALAADLLGHLYVHPRAQNRGVGSALLEVVKAQRPDGFRFWVFQKNEGARRFYERHGCVLLTLGDGSGNEEREPDALYEWSPETDDDAARRGSDAEVSLRPQVVGTGSRSCRPRTERAITSRWISLVPS